MSISLRIRTALFACLAIVTIALAVPLTANAAESGPSNSYDPPVQGQDQYPNNPPNQNYDDLKVYITDGPSEHRFTTDKSPTFKFRANDHDAYFKCRIDYGDWYSCWSPHTTKPLNDGFHEFFVKAKKGDDKEDQAHRRFLVDHDFVPDTEITSGPANREVIRDDTPTFTFRALNRRHFDGHFGSYPRGGQYGSNSGQYFDHADSHRAKFECRINEGVWYDCWSPYTTPSLADGDYTFAVRAIVHHRTDPTPATRTFEVDRFPDTTITGGPAHGATTDDSTPEFSFVSSLNPATFTCYVDGAAVACASPFTTSTLADGQHTFMVAATSNGFTDATPASRTFQVDVPNNGVVPPPLVITSAEVKGGSSNATFTKSKVTIMSRTGLIGMTGSVRIVVSCSGGTEACAGTLRIVKTIRIRTNDRGIAFVRKTLGVAKFTIPSGSQLAVKPRLTNAGLRMVSATSLHRMMVLALATDNDSKAQKAVLLIGR